MGQQIFVNGRPIGSGAPVYLVAEMSANHHGDFELAVKIIEEAKRAGADAVKLQTYTAQMLTIASEAETFRIGGGTLWDGSTLWDLYERAAMPLAWHARLKAVAAEIGIDLFSTAFDASAVALLEDVGVPVHKIASFELVDLALVATAARTGKPLILSTGMASLAEIEEAVTVARDAGATQIALLKCTSAYPAPAEEMNLRTMPWLAAAFDAPVGLSDHSLGGAVPVAAVALGAAIIEKHFTLSRSIPTADREFSLEPEEFRSMVAAVRVAEKALGGVRFGTGEEEGRSKAFRRSLYVVEDVAEGETLTDDNIRSIRPGFGLAPRYINEVRGRRAAVAIPRGTPLSWALIR